MKVWTTSESPLLLRKWAATCAGRMFSRRILLMLPMVSISSCSTRSFALERKSTLEVYSTWGEETRVYVNHTDLFFSRFRDGQMCDRTCDRRGHYDKERDRVIAGPLAHFYWRTSGIPFSNILGGYAVIYFVVFAFVCVRLNYGAH